MGCEMILYSQFCAKDKDANKEMRAMHRWGLVCLPNCIDLPLTSGCIEQMRPAMFSQKTLLRRPNSFEFIAGASNMGCESSLKIFTHFLGTI